MLTTLSFYRMFNGDGFWIFSGNGLLPTNSTAYFSYVMTNKYPAKINTIWTKLHQGSTGSGQTSAELGLFSTPLPPNGSGQTLTKLIASSVATGAGDFTQAGPAMVKQSGGNLNYTIPAGVNLWCGVRLSITSQPSFSGLAGTPALGESLQVASCPVFTSQTSFTGVLPAVNGIAPGLFCTVD